MNSQRMRRGWNDDGLAVERNTQAFTRLELAAVLGAVGLLALLTLPSLANQRERSGRLLCVNNLRQVGQALQQFGTEHGERLPWRTPFCEGGTMPNVPACPGMSQPPWFGIANDAWFQWSWISNDLRTPKILACPSDAQKTAATTWSLSPTGGFLHPNLQNRAVSYLAGLDVLPENREGLVAGDRNVRFNLGPSTCSSGLSGVPGLTVNGASGFGLGDGLHVEAGNFSFSDGRVEELNSRAFVARFLQITKGSDDQGSSHYLVP